MHRIIKSEISVADSDIKITNLGTTAGLQSVQIVVTLKDALGNYLSPGQAGAIQFEVDHGQPVGAVQDNVDGTYTQVIEMPVSLAAGAVLTVKLGDNTETVAWPKPEVPFADLFNWLTWLLIILFVLCVIYVMKRQNP